VLVAGGGTSCREKSGVEIGLQTRCSSTAVFFGAGVLTGSSTTLTNNAMQATLVRPASPSIPPAGQSDRFAGLQLNNASNFPALGNIPPLTRVLSASRVSATWASAAFLRRRA